MWCSSDSRGIKVARESRPLRLRGSSRRLRSVSVFVECPLRRDRGFLRIPSSSSASRTWPLLRSTSTTLCANRSKSCCDPSAMARTIRFKISAFMAILLSFAKKTSSGISHCGAWASRRFPIRDFGLDSGPSRRTYRHVPLERTERILYPRCRSDSMHLETVGIETPIFSASPGVENRPVRMSRSTSVRRSSISCDRMYSISKPPLSRPFSIRG